MEDLNEQKKMGLRKLLKFSLILTLIMSGNILDRVDGFVNLRIDPFLIYQEIARELYNLGWILLSYQFVPYKNLKIKALTFMFAIWAIVIILHNNFYDMQPSIISYTLYSCYLLWLARIALIKKEEVNKLEQYRSIDQYSQSGVIYNILMPVSTFRGLIQILLNPFANPLYETRILVAKQKITGIVNKRFIQMSYSESFVKSLIRKGGKVKLCKDYNSNKINSLIGKKLILGIRDCKRLEL